MAIAGFSIACSGALAQSQVSISGAIDGGVGHIKTERYSEWRQSSSSIAASSLTFSGKEDLGGGYATTFVLRSLFPVSTGAMSGGKLFSSEAKVGLEGPTGKVELGRLFSPTHQSLVFKSPSQSNFAGAFNLAVGGYSAYWDNSIRYTSPVFNGVSFVGQHSRALLDSESISNSRNGVGTALALHYVKGPVDLSGVVEHTATQTSPAIDYRVNRGTLMGTYDFRAFKAHLGHVNERYSGVGMPLEFDLSILGASAAISPALKLSIELGHKNFKNSANKANFAGLGAFYSLSKRTTVYSQIAVMRNEGASKQSLYRGITVLPGEDTSGYVVGIRHTF
jgi:GBP family porin